MITVHHLNDSRSQRILWLLEELGLPYEIRHYKRMETRLAPPELKAIHPLGKSPVITDGGRTVFESGAIIDYVIRRHGGGRLQPDPATPAYDDYQMWMHYAEGSAMLSLMLNLYVSRLGDDGAPLHPRIESEIAQTYGKRAAFPNLDAWVKRLHARPAYGKALAKGGPYRFDK
jgi:glutathione S-transferase